MPDLNAVPATSRVRQPRGAIKLNGQIVRGWVEWSVNNNRFRDADTFHVTLAATSLSAPTDLAWVLSQNSLQVEVFATENPADPANYAPIQADSLILGQVDDIDYDPDDRTVELSGRDLTAKLIDTRTSENHQNKTSSQVATLLAQREGLTPVVTSTSTIIGQYYQQDHTDINQQQSEWDLLCRLADFEGFDVYVKGQELHFEPKPQDSGNRYALVWTPALDLDGPPTANWTDMRFSRSLTIAKGVSVEVRSWNAKQKKAFTASWPRSVRNTKPGQSTSNNLKYHFSVPGLTQDQASLRAQQIYNQIIQHMVNLEATVPGDNILDCTKAIEVRGTGTTFDQVYYPDAVRRSMSSGPGEGYRMTISAKNISQDIEAAAS